MRVLVIDDSRTMRLLLGNMLRDLGMDVVEAADGVDALEKLAQERDFQLLLVDWNMPRLDGLEFIRRVRSQPSWNAVRILMVTTQTQSSQVSLALAAGADEYLMKPFDAEILAAKLNLLDMLPE